MWSVKLWILLALLYAAAASVARRGYRGSYGHRRRNGDSYEDYQDQADRYYYRGDDDYRGVQHRSHIIVHGDLHNHFNGAGLRQPDAHHADESEADERTYRFNLGPADFGPYGYIDPSSGIHQGFNRDLLFAVCANAGKKCNFVSDRWPNCWDAEGLEEYPGQGLLADWYDGCLGYHSTPYRRNSFNFSVPFTPKMSAGLYYRTGSIQGDPSDLTGRKIGFAKGWFANADCLARKGEAFKGNQVGQYSMELYENAESLARALVNEEVDAILAFREGFTFQSGKIQAVGADVYCSDGGMTLMTRYRNQAIIDWWNDAYSRMRDSGEIAELCAEAKRKHGTQGGLYCYD